jgi:tetratricopeptide (TPR) repeat protein
MKKIIILLLVFTALKSHAQNTKIDSLKRLLRTEIADTSRVMLLSRLADQYWFSSPDTSLFLAEQGLALAQQKNFEKGEAWCLYSLGSIFSETGNYPKSLDCYLQALKKFEKLNIQRGIIRAYACLGVVNAYMGDHQKAINYYMKGKTYAEANPDLPLLNYMQICLGDSYEKLNQLDSARMYTNQGYELALKLHIPGNKLAALNNLGNIYSKMQQGEIALGYYHQSLSMIKEVRDFDCLCETTLGMAALFKKTGQKGSSLYYARLSLATANEFGFTKWKLNASSFLSNYFKDLKNIDSAYYYQSITIAAKDSLFSQEKIKAVQNLSFEEKIRQQEIEEADRKAKEERKSNMQLIGIVAFISFLFALLFVFSKRHVNPAIIKFLGLLGLLLLFEFISLFLHPYIANFTHHKPILMLLILVAIASILVPTQHKLQGWVKERLAQKQMNALTIVSDNVLTE